MWTSTALSADDDYVRWSRNPKQPLVRWDCSLSWFWEVKWKKTVTSVILEQQYSYNGDFYDLIHTENNLKDLLSPLSKSHVGGTLGYMFMLVALVTQCHVVTTDGGPNTLNGNAVCCYFCIIIARCGEDGDADSDSSRTRKVHLMSMYISHTHTHNMSREDGRKGVTKRQWRGKTTTQIAAGGDAAVFIFDEWMASYTHTVLY